jgi:hypothetical protein
VPVLWNRLYKPRSRVAAGVARNRTPLQKAVSAKHKSKFATLSPILVTAARELKIAHVAINNKTAQYKLIHQQNQRNNHKHRHKTNKHSNSTTTETKQTNTSTQSPTQT